MTAVPAADPQLLDPAVLARISDLELVARTVVDGFLAGLHRSPHLGDLPLQDVDPLRVLGALGGEHRRLHLVHVRVQLGSHVLVTVDDPVGHRVDDRR